MSTRPTADFTTRPPKLSRFKQAVLVHRAATTELREAMAAECPGPHKFIDGRDGCGPWCRACVRTPSGDRPKKTVA